MRIVEGATSEQAAAGGNFLLRRNFAQDFRSCGIAPGRTAFYRVKPVEKSGPNGGLADAQDLKPCGGNHRAVRFPAWANGDRVSLPSATKHRDQ